MDTRMDEESIRKLAKNIAKDIKTEADLGDFSKLLRKIVVETALDAELTDHLGYEKNDTKGNGSGNSRNGKSKKRLKGDHGDIDLDIPRDREGTFEPQIVKKGQSRLTQMDDQILSLYAKGMSVRDITATFKELYDADVSPAVISKVTDAVLARVTEWQEINSCLLNSNYVEACQWQLYRGTNKTNRCAIRPFCSKNTVNSTKVWLGPRAGNAHVSVSTSAC